MGSGLPHELEDLGGADGSPTLETGFGVLEVDRVLFNDLWRDVDQSDGHVLLEVHQCVGTQVGATPQIEAGIWELGLPGGEVGQAAQKRAARGQYVVVQLRGRWHLAASADVELHGVQESLELRPQRCPFAPVPGEEGQPIAGRSDGFLLL